METKIIKAVFGGGTSTVTNKRTRTDYGQVLEIIGIDLPDTFECIFSNSATSAGTGKKMIGSNQRCLIPDEYLATGQTIYAWILLHDTEDDGRHMYSIRIPVADMPDTSSEEPTPVEQSVISQAITALNSAVTTTTQKAQEATESADRAEQAAEGAEGYAERAEAAQSASESARDIALEAKVSAQTSAATASEKASEAISSATTASQSAMTAENASESAQEYATASAESASASAESASQASQSADTASSKASDAQGYASSADTSAQTASQKALEAAQSAQAAVQAKTDAESAKTASQTAQGLAESARDGAVTAKTSAEDARDEAQSIVDGITGKVEQIDSNTDRIESLEDDRYKPYAVDTVSGAVASFPDGADNIPMKNVTVQIDPVQDLHGYDNPWPAGGGKNKFPVTLSSQVKNGTTFTVAEDGSVTISGTPSELTRVALNQLSVTPENAMKFSMTGSATGIRVFCSRTIDGSTSYPTLTPSLTMEAGAIYTSFLFEVATTFSGTVTVKFQMEDGTTVTDWSPYENICPISGFTGCEVQRTGKNVWDEEWEIGTISSTTGETISDPGRMRSKNYIPCVPSSAYCFTKVNVSNTTDIRPFFYDASKNFISMGAWSSINTVQNTPSNCHYIKFICATGYGTTYNHDISINYPSTDHDYHPYTGQTYPITFPSEAGTVYGAYVDVLNGELVVTHAEVDMGTLTGWINNMIGENAIEIACTLNGKKEGRTNVISDMLKTGTETSATDVATFSVRGFPKFAGIALNIAVKAPKALVTDLSGLVAWIDENHPTLCYELAEPIHYPLASNQINSLYGQNNIWANTGDTEVEYRADTKLYIEKLTQPEEYDMIADSAINSGQFFMIGNSLYRALANIASGATITVGTNAERVSLSDALNLVNA